MTVATMTLEHAHRHGLDLVRRHTDRFLDLVLDLPEEQLHAQVPGSDWTVAQTVVHLQTVLLRYTIDRRRVDDASQLGARNQDDVDAAGDDVAAAAVAIREQLDLLAAALDHIDPAQMHPFHAGQSVTLAGGWGNLLGELLAHGHDIIRVTGGSFTVPSEDLEVLWRFTAPVLQGWLRPEATSHRDRWHLDMPFGTIGVAFHEGQLEWRSGGWDEEPDDVVAVDDTARFTLTFPYRRLPAADPVVAELVDRFYEL